MYHRLLCCGTKQKQKPAARAEPPKESRKGAYGPSMQEGFPNNGTSVSFSKNTVQPIGPEILSQVQLFACCSTNGAVLWKIVCLNGHDRTDGLQSLQFCTSESTRYCSFGSSALKADYALHFAVVRTAGGATRAAQKKRLLHASTGGRHATTTSLLYTDCLGH